MAVHRFCRLLSDFNNNSNNRLLFESWRIAPKFKIKKDKKEDHTGGRMVLFII